jgi:transposase
MSDQFVNGTDRKQRILLPDTLDEDVDENNPVRFIDAFVDSLDLVSLGLRHSVPASTGRPPYNPGDLLKLYMYCYLNSVRSSRKLEHEAYRNIEVIWLMKKLRPDHKTISDFRRNNASALREVFRQFVFFCRELDLFGGELIGVDSTKLRAVNSSNRNFTLVTVEKKLREIDSRIEKYLDEMEQQDEIDSKRDGHKKKGKGGQTLQDKIKQLKEKREWYSKIHREMKNTGVHEVSLTDRDSRTVRCNGTFFVGYNAHAAVDARNHLIADYNVTNKTSDGDALFDIASSARETLGADRIEVVADRGYFSSQEIKKCIDDGIMPYVPAPSRSRNGETIKRGIPTPDFFDSKFRYDRRTDTYTCPANKLLTFRFATDGRYHDMTYRVYGTRECFRCIYMNTKCTVNRTHGRRMWRYEHQNLIDEMRKRMANNPSMMSVRQSLCEHPFGTIKRAFNQGYLLLKGFRKVVGEIGLTMLAYNMRRVLNIMGTKKLVKAAAGC